MFSNMLKSFKKSLKKHKGGSLSPRSNMRQRAANAANRRKTIKTSPSLSNMRQRAANAANRRRSIKTSPSVKTKNDFQLKILSMKMNSPKSKRNVSEAARAKRNQRAKRRKELNELNNDLTYPFEEGFQEIFGNSDVGISRTDPVLIARAERSARYNTEYVKKEMEKYVLPFPEINSLYPKMGGNWSYEENLADGNCLYYSVLRSLQRRLDPTSNPLNNSNKRILHNNNLLLTPYIVHKFKKYIRDSSEYNKKLMSVIVRNSDRGILENLMANYVYGESVCMQAMANFLNCCICIFLPKNTPFAEGYKTDRNAWHIYTPDTDSTGDSKPSEQYEGAGVWLPNREVNDNRGYPVGKESLITLTDEVEPITYYYSGTSTMSSGVLPEYITDSTALRTRIKDNRLKYLNTVLDNCNEPLFIQSQGGGHFFSIEYNHQRNGDRNFTSGYSRDPIPEGHKAHEIMRILNSDIQERLKDKKSLLNIRDIDKEIRNPPPRGRRIDSIDRLPYTIRVFHPLWWTF